MPFGLKNKLNSPLQELTNKVRALKTKNLSLNSAVFTSCHLHQDKLICLDEGNLRHNY